MQNENCKMQKSKCLRVRNFPFSLLHLNSGFNIRNQVKIGSQDERGRESLAQYILRSPFSQEKMTSREETKAVLHQSKINLNISCRDRLSFCSCRLVRTYGC